MVVGPPGTGKTDTAVQILNVLYHNCPSQRTLIITHSNQALNDLFEKIMQVLLLNNMLSQLLLLILDSYPLKKHCKEGNHVFWMVNKGKIHVLLTSKDFSLNVMTCYCFCASLIGNY